MSKSVADGISKLEPMASLSADSIRALAAGCRLESVAAGATLFKAGVSDAVSLYLIAGTVELTGAAAGKDIRRTVTAEGPEARYPLDEKQPHQVTAVALSAAEIVRVDHELLDKIISQDQLAVCQAAAPSAEARAKPKTEGGFFAKLAARFSSKGGMQAASETIDAAAIIARFRPPLFATIPDDDMRKLCGRFAAVTVKAGTVVIRQGEEGDYYYLIVGGTASVTRQTDPKAEPIFLADLGEGQSFGEEALVSNAKRNATVTMKTKGTLLRLAKQDFIELLKEPLLNWISSVEAQTKIQQGAKWLDVRPTADFQQSHLTGALSIPLHELRARMNELDKSALYICCCDTGRLSSSAAFLLGQRGYKAAILRGGLQRATGS